MYEDIKQLIKEFEKLPKQDVKDETFISIIRGKAQDEKVSSNILAFFLDTTREHNLGDLFVKSLLESINYTCEQKISNYVSMREFPTRKGKLIDILLVSGNNKIVIENKIGAGLYNDLKDYYDSVEEKDGQTIGIVLTLNELLNDDINKYVEKYYTEMYFHSVKEGLDYINDKYHFITYDKLFDRIKNNWGKYIQEASKKYLPLLLDFIDNIESLKRTEQMNANLINLLKEFNCKEVDHFAVELSKLKKEIDDKIKNVYQDLSEKLKDKEQPLNTQIHTNSDDIFGFFNVLAVDYININEPFILDCYLSFEGWHFAVFSKCGKDPNHRVYNTTLPKYLNRLKSDYVFNQKTGKYDLQEKVIYHIDTENQDIVNHIYALLSDMLPELKGKKNLLSEDENK